MQKTFVMFANQHFAPSAFTLSHTLYSLNHCVLQELEDLLGRTSFDLCKILDLISSFSRKDDSSDN